MGKLAKFGCLGLIGLVILVLVIGALASAGKSGSPATVTQSTVTPSAAKPAEPPQLALAKVGDRVESGGVALTIVKVDKASEFGQFAKAKPENVYITVEVVVENAGRDGAMPYNPLYFKVKDSEGFEYTTAFGGPELRFKTGELVKGEKARGFVAFEVKQSARGLSLSYQPLVIFGGYRTIRVDLGI